MENVNEKSYELRPLVATDMGAVCKIISAIGIRQFGDSFKYENLKDLQGKSIDKIGISIAFEIAGIIIENIPKAESEIQLFLASVSGMKLSEIKQMKFADYGAMIIEVVLKDDFRDFFGRVMKLFNL